MPIFQNPTIILPQVAPLGTETETVADALEHVSLSFPADSIQEKVVYVYAVNAAGLAAPLEVWIEIAPSDVAAAYVMLGAAPTILVVTGDVVIPWTTHSSFARVVAQCPAYVIGGWVLQVVVGAKG